MRIAVITFLISAILFTAIVKAAATCVQECSNKGYSSGICRSWAVVPTAKVGCETNETNIGETSDCYVQPGFAGVGRTCCCLSGGTTITTTIPTTSTVSSTTISSDEKITTTTSKVPSATTTIPFPSVTIDDIMGADEENPLRILENQNYNLKNVGGKIVRLSFDWTYIQNNGWSIKNGELRGNGTFDNYIIANTGDLADYTIEAKVKAMDSNLGDMSLIAGYQDVNNSYLISAKDSSLAIHKKVNGTYQQFKTSWSIPTITQGVWHNLTISHTGYTLRVWWDGTHVGDWTDNDKNIKWSSGKVGARQDWYRSVSFDYVKINGQLYDDFAAGFNSDKWFFPLYDYSWSDDKVNDAFNNGLEVIGILGGKPNWLDMNMSIPNGVDSSDEKFFAEFVETTVTRYRGKVKFWEIYNEQNDKIPENYAKLLKVGYLKIKEIDPTLKVSVAGTSGTCVEWIEKVFEYFENRGEPHHYADMIGIHPYSFGLLGPDDIQENISKWNLCSHGTLLDNMARAKQLIEKHSKNEELWITEIGWSTHSHSFSVVDEGTQSVYIVQTLTEALSTQYLKKVMWAKFRDEEGWWDPFDHMGMLDDEGNPKKSYFAVKNMYEKLKSLPYKKSASTEAGVHAYVFGNEAKDVVVAWSSTPKSIPIYINSDFCDKFDLYGNFSGRLYAANGKVDLTVDKTPVYLECRMENVTTTSTTTSSTSTTTSSTTTTTIDNTKKCIDAGGECKTSCATENIVYAIGSFLQNLINWFISLFTELKTFTASSYSQEIGNYPEYCTEQLPKCCKEVIIAKPRFNVTVFNITSTIWGHNINLSFNNSLEENATVLFIITNEQGLVVDYFNMTVFKGIGSLSKLINCTSLEAGNYIISWEAYLESDNKLLNVKTWSKPNEWKIVSCPSIDRYVVSVAQDGSGDFTDIQEAVNYVRNTWGEAQKTIKIKKGTYVINRYPNLKPYAGLVLPSNTILQGESGVVIKEVENGWMERLITNEYSCTYNQTSGKCEYKKTGYKDSNIVIKNLVVDGNKASQSYPYNTYRHCIWFLNSKDVVIENVTIINCAGIGTSATWSSNVQIKGCHFKDNDGSVYFDRSISCGLENSVLEDSNGGVSHINIFFSTNMSVLNNVMLRSGQWGIDADSMKDSLIKGNVIAFNYLSGIVLWSNDCVDEQHPEGGQAASGNRIIGNKIYNNGINYLNQYDGISLSHNNQSKTNTTNNTIENNQIFDNQTVNTQRYAIIIAYPTDDYNVIRNNYYWGNIKDSEGVVGFYYGKANNTVLENNININPYQNYN